MNFQIESSQPRATWQDNRAYLEENQLKSLQNGTIIKATYLIDKFLPFLVLFLKITGNYRRGIRNGLNVQLKKVNLEYEDLPDAFHGYKILQLTDLHLDIVPGIENQIIRRIQESSYDFVAFTGDYKREAYGPHAQVMEPMRQIISALDPDKPRIAILGNHDSYQMVPDLESLGLKVLINESITISSKGEEIVITGVDDPHSYYSSQIRQAIEGAPAGFRILLAHSPEIAILAANNQFRLYLAGHTHGGQINLPGGFPLVTHLYFEKKKYAGLWKEGDMTGYTSPGCGMSGVPLRYNTVPEITEFTLLKKHRSY